MTRASTAGPLRPSSADRALAARAMDEIGRAAVLMANMPACAEAFVRVHLDPDFAPDGRQIGATGVWTKQGESPSAHEAMRMALAKDELAASEARLKALLGMPAALRNRPSMHLDLEPRRERLDLAIIPWYAGQQIAGRTPADKLARMAMTLRLLAEAETPPFPADTAIDVWTITLAADADGKTHKATTPVHAPDLPTAVRITTRQFALALAVRRARPYEALRVTVTGAERTVSLAGLIDAVALCRARDAACPEVAGLLATA